MSDGEPIFTAQEEAELKQGRERLRESNRNFRDTMMAAGIVTRLADNSVTVSPLWHRLSDLRKEELARALCECVEDEAVTIIDGETGRVIATATGFQLRFEGEET
jgi:hypothetical protein